MAGKERIVGLTVKARDEFSGVLKRLKEEGRQAQLAFRAANNAEISKLTAEIKKTDQALRALTASGSADRAEVARLVIQKGKLAEAANKARRSLDSLNAAVAKGAKGSFSQFNQAANSIDLTTNKVERLKRELASLEAKPRGPTTLGTYNLPFSETSIRDRQVEDLRVEIDRLESELRQSTAATVDQTAADNASVPALMKKEDAIKKVAVAQDRLTASTEKAAASSRRMSGSTGPLPGARERNQGKKGDAQEIEVFGLKPWQLTNLGYQVNDVISGFAMGQNPIQILAQQAGQFAQIWPNVMVSLARSIPIVGGVAIAFAPFIGAMRDMSRESDSLTHFTAKLGLMADGAQYSAERLMRVSEELYDIGASIEDARGLIDLFVGEGFTEGSISRLSKLALDLSKVAGIDASSAGRKIADAFSGNIESVRELDKELKFLTADQLIQLRAMEKSGNAAGAMALATDILTQKIEDGKTAPSDWADAVGDMAEAWGRLKDAMRDGIVFKGLKLLADFPSGVVRGTAVIANEIAVAIDPTTAPLPERFGAAADRQFIAQQNFDEGAAIAAQGGVVPLALLQEELDAANAALEAVIEAYRATAPQAEGLTQQTEEQKKNAADLNGFIDTYIEDLAQGTSQVSEQNREIVIQNALLEARNEAMKKANELGATFTGLTAEQMALIRETVGGQFDEELGTRVLGNLGSLVDKITGVESGGDPNAKNPDSTATGTGQFIESTWLRMFKQYFPDRAASLNDAMILELRKNAEVSREMVALYASENADLLKKAGLAVTEASLYLAHFLGPQGAISVLSAPTGTPVTELLDQGAIASNPTILGGGATNLDVVLWAQKKMGISEQELNITQELAAIDADRAETAQEYTSGLAERLEDQKAELALLGASGRVAAISKALREEEQKAAKAGIELTEEQRRQIEANTGALYDQQNVETDVNRILEKRTTLFQMLEAAKVDNNTSEMTRLSEEITLTDEQLGTAVDKAITFWQAMGGADAENAILKLQAMKSGLQEIASVTEQNVLPTAESLNNQFVDIGGNTFSAMAEAFAEGKSVGEAFFSSMTQGFGQLLIDIGKAIVQQSLLNAITATGGSGGSIGGIISNAVAGIFHSGGVIGGPAPSRAVNPSIFAGATRYHTGGVVGLKPNEVPIIAMREEEMITRQDPRHIKNGGGASGARVKIVNVIDPVELLRAAVADEAGEQVMINYQSRNARRLGKIAK
jgi:hypothetical protein